MATTKKEEQRCPKVKVKLTDPNTYWKHLEMEGKHCLRDI